MFKLNKYETTNDDYIGESLYKKEKEEWDTLKEQIKTDDTLSNFVSSGSVNYVALTGRSKSCVFSISNLRTEPRQPLTYKKEFYLSGNVKGTAGCKGQYAVLVKTRGEQKVVQIIEKQGAFRAGLYTADIGTIGGTTCGNVYAGAIESVDASAVEAAPILAKAAFLYDIYGCSDTNLCGSIGTCEPAIGAIPDDKKCIYAAAKTREEKIGKFNPDKKMSACMQYFGEDPCISPHIDASCLQEVKWKA